MTFDRKANRKAYMKAYVKAKHSEKSNREQALKQLKKINTKLKGRNSSPYSELLKKQKQVILARINAPTFDEAIMSFGARVQKAMILDGVSLDRELKKHKIRVKP